MRDWIDWITDKTISEPDNQLDYTQKAGYEIQSLIRKDDFSFQDAELIYHYLSAQVRSISFGDYLKRYIYYRFQIPVSFETISDNEFCEMLKASFLETGTPKSFHRTSTTLGVLIRGWLEGNTVSRETVFLLGFALQMAVADVSVLLTKAIHEQDINFENPEEIVYWYCLRSGNGAVHALEVLDKYYGSGGKVDAVKSILSGSSAEAAIAHLERLEKDGIQINSAEAAGETFEEYLEETKKIIKRLYAEEDLYALDTEKKERTVREADIEKVLYNGIPLDDRGNMLKISRSSLGKEFAHYRLTRQRLSKLMLGKTSANRYDLITLKFFIDASEEEEDPVRRYKQFIREMDRALLNCRMGRVNISNPYEAFILVCILAEDPMGAFSEVWEISYR